MIEPGLIARLNRGDVVRHANGDAYIVIENNGNGTVLAIRTLTVSNPQEWTLVKKHDWTPTFSFTVNGT